MGQGTCNNNLLVLCRLDKWMVCLCALNDHCQRVLSTIPNKRVDKKQLACLAGVQPHSIKLMASLWRFKF